MLVICVAAAKGGTGCSTIAAHLACQAEAMRDGPVMLVDTDPQQSIGEWWRERKAETPGMGGVDPSDMPGSLKLLRAAGAKLVIIDTQPTITSDLGKIIRASDIVLVPTRPSPHDLRSVRHTVALVEVHKKPMVFVINGAANRARITNDAVIELSQHGTVAKTIIHQRTDFASSMIDGRTVGEVDPKSKSAQEIAELWQYVKQRATKLAS